MAVVLVTGMSGAGKSMALAELARRGHRVVDTDDGDWTEDVPLGHGLGSERLWREDKMSALISEHVASTLFIWVVSPTSAISIPASTRSSCSLRHLMWFWSA